MPMYAFLITKTQYTQEEVEADNEDDARNMALEQARELPLDAWSEAELEINREISDYHS